MSRPPVIRFAITPMVGLGRVIACLAEGLTGDHASCDQVGWNLTHEGRARCCGRGNLGTI